MTADLVAFLRARYDEETAAASAASEGPWVPWRKARLHGLGDLQHAVMLPGQSVGSRATIVTASWLDAEHIARHDPARVLAEVDANRRMLDELDQAFAQRKALADTPHSIEGSVRLLTSLRFVKLLALPYADHPDYREEWRP